MSWRSSLDGSPHHSSTSLVFGHIFTPRCRLRRISSSTIWPLFSVKSTEPMSTMVFVPPMSEAYRTFRVMLSSPREENRSAVTETSVCVALRSAGMSLFMRERSINPSIVSTTSRCTRERRRRPPPTSRSNVSIPRRGRGGALLVFRITASSPRLITRRASFL